MSERRLTRTGAVGLGIIILLIGMVPLSTHQPIHIIHQRGFLGGHGTPLLPDAYRQMSQHCMKHCDNLYSVMHLFSCTKHPYCRSAGWAFLHSYIIFSTVWFKSLLLGSSPQHSSVISNSSSSSLCGKFGILGEMASTGRKFNFSVQLR